MKGFADCELSDEFSFNYWATIMQVRDEVNKLIEAARSDGDLGSPLEAEVMLCAEPKLAEQLKQLGDELRFVLITSAATVCEDCCEGAVDTDMDGLKVLVTVSKHDKCERCWHRRADVGSDSEHPGICTRCVDNIAKVGETRQFA